MSLITPSDLFVPDSKMEFVVSNNKMVVFCSHGKGCFVLALRVGVDFVSLRLIWRLCDRKIKILDVSP